MSHSVFIFDLDGTLLDTLADLGWACNQLLERHHFPTHPLPIIRGFVGNGFTKLVQRALPGDVVQRLTDEEMQALVDEGKAIYRENLWRHTRPYDGIDETVRALAGRGVRMGVLSNKPDRETRLLVEHFFPGLFRVVHGGRETIPLKPDPTALFGMMEELDCRREDIAYVGDTSVDMKTAANAGVFSLGVTWGFRPWEEIVGAGARVLVGHPQQLLLFAQTAGPAQG